MGMDILERSTRSNGPATLLAFVLIVAVVAFLGSSVTEIGVGTWYEELAKPPWQPPSWVFAPVWTLLYVAIAVAGWLWWREGTIATTVIWWWSVQLALNLAWSGIFFGLHRPAWALITIAALDIAIYACVLVGWEIRRAASAIMLPYLAWTALATALNFAVVTMN
jgi:benzodiazapine receptor